MLVKAGEMLLYLSSDCKLGHIDVRAPGILDAFFLGFMSFPPFFGALCRDTQVCYVYLRPFLQMKACLTHMLFT